MAKRTNRRGDARPEIRDEWLRLPGPDDPLTTTEQDDLARRLPTLAGVLLEAEVENVQRMHATLRLYREWLNILDHDPDAACPPRIRRNGIDHLYERRCRVCGCSDLRSCFGGCYWVEQDLCSECAGKQDSAIAAQMDGSGKATKARTTKSTKSTK